MSSFIYVLLAASIILGSIAFSVWIELRYSHAAILYGLLAILLAPVVVQKVEGKRQALGLLAGLAFMASFPLRKYLEVPGLVMEAALMVAYLAVLWLVSLAWKRDWR